jgi:hypothetical protein
VAAFPKIELTIARRSQPPRRTSTRNARSRPHKLDQIARQNEPVVASKCSSGRPLLTESAPQVEFVLTRSKQTTEKILTEARTHISIFGFLPFSTQNPGQLIQRLPIHLRGKNPKNSATVNVHLSRRLTRASLPFHIRPATLAPLFHVLCEDAYGHEPHTSENNGGTMKRAALLVLLFAALAPAAPAPDDYTINVHVTSSYKLFIGSAPQQGLDVVINGKKYQLGGQYRGGILALGDYKAKLTKDQHPNAYESNQEYEFLFPDNKTRTYLVLGQSE